MAMVKPAIFQIVGFQNSGKTTFSKRVIEELEKLDFRVATIKHHGHGGKPEFDDSKDSYQHISAGAVASLVEGEGHLLLQSEKTYWSLDEKINLLSYFHPDIILIEGHKYEPFSKAVLIRNEEDLVLLETLENIKVVFLWDLKMINVEYPTFQLNDPKGIQWLQEYFVNSHH